MPVIDLTRRQVKNALADPSIVLCLFICVEKILPSGARLVFSALIKKQISANSRHITLDLAQQRDHSILL